MSSKDMPYQDPFPETRWSLIRAAGQGGSSARERALETVCTQYWRPVCSYLRARGLGAPDAEDLTQEFLLHVMEHETLRRADPRLGRFRAYLLGALRRFLGDQQDRVRALKRGGGRRFVTFDRLDGREALAVADPTHVAPDVAFDQCWALTLLARAMSRLQEEYAGRGQSNLALELSGYLSAEAHTASYAQSAERLGLSLVALKSAVLRLRRRYGALVRDEVARTVSSPHEVTLEIRHLFAVLGSRGRSVTSPD